MESNELLRFTWETPANTEVDLRRHTTIHLKADALSHLKA